MKKLRLFLRFLQLDTVFLEKIGNALRRRQHPFVPLMPSGRADFAVSFNELQSVNDPQRFVDVAADGQVVDYLMADDTGFVNQKRSAERGAVFVEDAVIVRDFLGNIETSGNLMSPMPPASTGIFFQARCECFESTLTPITLTPRLLNSASRLLWAMISDGQMNVKSAG